MLAMALGCGLWTAQAQQRFTPGNLVVLRLGNGLQDLTNSGNTIYLDQYTTSGEFVDSVRIPDTGSKALVQSGSASSEGMLSVSPDGLSVAFAGYHVERPYSGSLADASFANAPRAAGYVDYLGNFTLATSSISIFSKNNIRSAVKDGTNVWVGGASSGGVNGIYWLGAAAAGLTTNVFNARSINIYNSNLYASTQSGTTARGIWAFSGEPTAPATCAQVVATGTNSKPNDFVFNDAGTLLYVAEEDPAAGVERWTNSGGTWSLQYAFTNSGGVRSIAVDFSGTNPVIYAIPASGSNRLVRLVDAGAGATGTVIATAIPDVSMRAVRFAPTLNAPKSISDTSDWLGTYTNSRPSLPLIIGENWSWPSGVHGCLVGLTMPSGATWWTNAKMDPVSIPFDLPNGDYTWTVTWLYSNNVFASSARASFTVQLPTLHFALLCDNQSAKISDNYPMYASNSISHELIFLAKHIAKQPVDFVLFGGDLIGTKDIALTNLNILTNRYFAWREAMGPIRAAGIPVYPVRGNHDAVYDASAYSSALATGASNVWASQFSHLTNYEILTDGPMFTHSQLSFPNYVFTRNRLCVIALDDYANSGKVDTNFIRSVFSTSLYPMLWESSLFLILKHQPIWNDSDKVNPTNASDIAALVSLLDSKRVSVVLCGHVHEYSHLIPTNHAFRQIIDGKAGSPPTGVTYTPPDGWIETKDTQTNFGYCYFTVQGTNLSMEWRYFNSLDDTAYTVGDAWTNNVILPAISSVSPNGALLSQSQPAITWSAVPGAVYYLVTLTYPGGSTKTSLAASTNWTPTNALANGAYSYTIAAVGGAWSSPPASGTFVIQNGQPALSVAQSGTNVTISWPTNTAPAQVLRSDTPDFAAFTALDQPATLLNGNNTVTVPATNLTQYYRLRISAQ